MHVVKHSMTSNVSTPHKFELTLPILIDLGTSKLMACDFVNNNYSIGRGTHLCAGPFRTGKLLDRAV